MCRNYDFYGIFSMVCAYGLLAFANYCGNILCVLYWFKQTDVTKRPFEDVQLTTFGVIHFILFNGLFFMVIVAHLRASMGDPGFIPKDIELPDYVDTAVLKSCD
jgi:hypothetical protein